MGVYWNREKESGYVLVLALVVMVVLFLFGSALWFYSTAETIQVVRFERATKAHYLARSGMDISEKIIGDSYEFFLSYKRYDFYIYGDLDGSDPEIYVQSGSYSGEEDDREILVVVELDIVDGEVIGGTIRSRGRFLDTTEQITRDFSFDADWSESSEYLTTSPPSGAADAGPDGLEWYSGDGKMQPGGHSNNSDQPVSLYGNPVIYEDQASGQSGRYFAAPAMFFVDEDGSLGTLEIRQQNAKLLLKTNYLVINGDLIFKEQGNSKGEVLVEIYENIAKPELNNTLFGSSLTAKDLNGNDAISSKKYGVFYIGGTIKEENNAIINADVEPGFYLFPEGINLGSSTDLSTLIKIDDVTTLDLGPLGLETWFNSESGSPLDFGIFQ